MKAIKYIVLAILALHFLQTNALTFKSGGLWFKATSETTARLVASKDDPYVGDIVIPETVSYEGLTMTVNAIGQGAFSSDSLMTSVFIPKTIESIRDFSFEACYSLERITVDPDNSFFTSVDGVLYDKDQISLKVCPGAWEGEFVIPNGVNYVEFAAFFSCKKVTSIYIPESVVYITMEGEPVQDPDEMGDNSDGSGLIFKVIATTFNYPALQGFVIDENNPMYSFENNCLISKPDHYILKVLGQVPEHLVIPEGVEGIYTAACRRKFNLREVSIPKSLKFIGKNAFNDCPLLTKINIPEDSQLETVESKAFSSTTIKDLGNGMAQITYTVLDSLYLPSSIREIGGEAFCTKALKIGEGLSVYNWNSVGFVERVYLPSSIDEIVGQCPASLSHIEIQPGGKYIAEKNVLFSSDKSTLFLCAPKGVVGSYKIPSSVTRIQPRAFYFNSTITELTIPGSIKVIPEYMFFNENHYYSVLRKLIIEEGVEELHPWCFEYNEFLQSVRLPSTLKSGEMYSDKVMEVFDLTPDRRSRSMFPHAVLIHYTDEPSSIKKSPEGLLYGKNENGETVLIGYEGDSGDVILPELIDDEEYSYCYGLFNNCTRIKHLTLPNNKSIFDFCDYLGQEFVYCSNILKKITIPKGATIEGFHTNVFRNLNAEIELDPENSFMCYEGNVLYNKDKTLIIAYNSSDSIYEMPETVSEICMYAFKSDSKSYVNRTPNLKSLTLGKNLNSVSPQTFNLDGLTKLVIPDGINLLQGAISINSSRFEKHVEIELGAGSYGMGSIVWSYIEQISNKDSCIIKCDFSEPLAVQCPFQLDVDYWGNVTHQATLHVPYGTKEKFATAPDWSLFDHIVETFDYIAKKYAVTYMVDGNVYRQDSVFENTEIVLPDVPQRDGYKFSGWSEVPSTMGFRDIIVEGYFYKLGDVNDDSKVNIIDINNTVDMIVYQYNYDLSTYEGGEKMIKSADVNEDTFVDIADVYGIANYIMEGSFSPAQNARPRNVGSVNDTEPCLMVIPESEPFGNDLYLTIVLDNPCQDIVAMQFDLSLPDGIQIAEEDAIMPMNDTSHSLKWNTTTERGVRFVNYSIANSVIKDEDATVVKVKVRTECDLSVDSSVSLNHVVLVSSSGQITRADYTCPLFSTDETSGIEEIHKESYGSENTIYDVTGQRHILPQKGLNIVGGKIFLVK